MTQKYVDNAPGLVARDGNRHPVESLSTINWRASKAQILNSAWTEIGDGERRNHLIVRTLTTATAVVVLSHSNTAGSNDLTDAACGFPVSPGESIPLAITENVKVYARVESGGASTALYIAEAL